MTGFSLPLKLGGRIFFNAGEGRKPWMSGTSLLLSLKAKAKPTQMRQSMAFPPKEPQPLLKIKMLKCSYFFKLVILCSFSLLQSETSS